MASWTPEHLGPATLPNAKSPPGRRSQRSGATAKQPWRGTCRPSVVSYRDCWRNWRASRTHGGPGAFGTS